MASTKLVLKMNKKNSSGEVPIYLRIIKDRKTRFVSLGVYLNPVHWNETDKVVRKSHKNAKYINAYLADKMADAQKLALDMENTSKVYTPKKVRRVILGKTTDSFIKYADEYAARLLQKSKHGTHGQAIAVLSKLKRYLNDNDLSFDSIDVSFLKQYESNLRFQLHNTTNTIHSNMMVIRRIINCAINEDIFPVEKNPFLKYKLKSESVTKTFLTEAELTTLEEFSIVKGSKRFHHRNMYVFAAYSGGMRISDVLQLKWENFDGERVLVKTQKTGSVISIKLPAKALQIIESYKSPDNKPSDYVFPILANDDYSSKSALLFKSICSATAYTNADLKTIAKLAEIDKPLNFHTSRHTWATRALKKGMRIEYVSKLMGHASIKTTQVYAKIVNADLDKAMEVFDEVLPVKKATSKSTTKKKKTAKKKV